MTGLEIFLAILAGILFILLLIVGAVATYALWIIVTVIMQFLNHL